jgi:hypothetical protein
MLAVAALLSGRRRRVRRHLIVWPLILLTVVALTLLHGCMSFLHLAGL